jgi:hypothetical protein
MIVSDGFRVERAVKNKENSGITWHPVALLYTEVEKPPEPPPPEKPPTPEKKPEAMEGHLRAFFLISNTWHYEFLLGESHINTYDLHGSDDIK